MVCDAPGAVMLRCANTACGNGIGLVLQGEGRTGLVLRCRLCSDVFCHDVAGAPRAETLRGADILTVFDNAGPQRAATLRRYGLAA